MEATRFEGWFYEGAGIYRHVWLDKTAPVALAPDGIFVYSSFKNNVPSGSAELHVEATLLNTLANSAAATVDCEVISPEGKSLARFKEPAKVADGSQETVKLQTRVSSPTLSSPESPRLYKLITTVSVGGKTVDQQETAFGIRTVEFNPANGFLLNGKHYEIQGVCIHQDWPGVGAAVPDSLQYYRVRKLKEMGCNAIRTAHNPYSPEFYEACDQLGMLVMDENRRFGSDPENLQEWGVEIRRDRNHPSVAIWCVGNEEFTVQDTVQGANVALTMQNLVKRLDPTRPVTYAAPNGLNFRGINSVIEVRGWNYFVYNGANAVPDEAQIKPPVNVDVYHAAHPTQPNVATEVGSIYSTRGIYATDQRRCYYTAYDDPMGWNETARSLWSFFAARPWMSGLFIWTGFDYGGEPTPFRWPAINSQYGILDRCGFPKDTFYYYQSWWQTNPVLHLLPHWNWPGKEGQEIRVVAYSNCKQVELFLNGTSLGRQAMKKDSNLTWQVKYAPGILSAKGFDSAGNVIAETKVETAGDAVRIQLTPDRKTINADGEDVAVFTVSALDAQGRAVPLADNKIDFAIEGTGKIIGVGNGNPTCHEPDTFTPQSSVRYIAVNNWRWKEAEFSTGRRTQAVPEFAPDFDDSSWSAVKLGDMPMKGNSTAIYRAHVNLTQEDLDNPGARIHFTTIDDHGWIYVNNQRVGESHDWTAEPVFDIEKRAACRRQRDRRGREERRRLRRLESEGERGNRRQGGSAAVVAQPVQRPGANHRAIHARRRRIQTDRQC